MLLRLPLEALTNVFDFSRESDSLRQLLLVSSALSAAVRDYQLRQPILRSSSAVQAYLGHARDDARILTVARGARSRIEVVKSGRATVRTEIEDSVTEEDLVQLCRRSPNTVTLILDQPAFSTLRRRQLGFAFHLRNLRTMAIIGRDDAGFNLTTIGLILNSTPGLVNLELRNLQASPASLSGISPPAYRLSTFSMHTIPFLRSTQLYWLLESSTQAESLRTVKFHLPSQVSPSTLHPVYWAPIRVTSLHISSADSRPIECMPLHLPHLERLVLRSDSQIPVDARQLLKSATKYRRLCDLRDETNPLGAKGLDLRTLAEGLLLYRRKLLLRRITIRSGREQEDGFRELEEVCKEIGTKLERLARCG